MSKFFNSTDARNLIKTYDFALFPIHGIVDGKCTCGDPTCTNQGKHPATGAGGLNLATKDIEKLKELWNARPHLNVGIATGETSGVFVIDIDGPQGEKDLEYLEKTHGKLPDTLQQKTGKGRHLFFKHPHQKIKTRTKVIGDKIDVRGDGGYVAGPGSNHISGNRYEWVNPLVDILPAPQWLIDIVTKDKEIPLAIVQPTLPAQGLPPISRGLPSLSSERWSDTQIADMLQYISADDRDTWIFVGMALQNDNYSFSLWDQWSAKSPKYKTGETQAKWHGFTPGKGKSFGTVVHYARAAGWAPQSTQSTVQPTVPVTVVPAVIPKDHLQPKIKATSINDIDLTNIPPREFLYHNIAARKYATMIVAPPGAGKSIFTLHMAISAAAGRQWGSWGTANNQPIRVWVYNNEEGIDELRRRIKGIMQEMGVTKEMLGGRLFIDSGENRPIEVAKNGDGNTVIHTPDFHALKQEVIDRQIDMLIVDPFAETYSVAENDNDQIKQVARMYRDIAVEANCAVVLVHHTRKGMTGQAGNADMARGGSAQIGVVRRAFTLSSMDEDDAKALGVPLEKKRWFVRFDDAKSNITAPQNSTDWLKLKSVHIGNGAGLFPEGDSIGVLTHTDPEKILAEFAGQLEEEYKDMFALVADYLDTCRLEGASVAKISDSLSSKPGAKYKKRKMQDFIKAAITHLQKSYSVMCNDGQTFLSISDKEGKGNVLEITRRVRSND